MDKRSKILMCLIILLCFSLICCALLLRNRYLDLYNNGIASLESGDYTKAIEYFTSIPNYNSYRDVKELLSEYEVTTCPYCGSVLN